MYKIEVGNVLVKNKDTNNTLEEYCYKLFIDGSEWFSCELEHWPLVNAILIGRFIVELEFRTLGGEIDDFPIMIGEH